MFRSSVNIEIDLSVPRFCKNKVLDTSGDKQPKYLQYSNTQKMFSELTIFKDTICHSHCQIKTYSELFWNVSIRAVLPKEN